MTQYEEKTMDMKLETMGEGVVAQRFKKAMAEVAKNITDPNTDYRIKRKIVLTLTFTPGETRDVIGVDVGTQTKLAPETAVQTSMAIGGDGKGNLVTAEWQRPALPMGAIVNDEGDLVDKDSGEIVQLHAQV